MRRALLGSIAFGLFACNAILGNEDHYVLVSPGEAGHAGSVSKAGANGKAGSSAAGESGEGGVAGAGDEAGSSGASEADSGESSSGGTTGHGGNGAAGSAPCVKTGVEDCYNGKDDDCNGATDCADSACTPTSTCVPDATDAELGTLLQTGSACPTGYTAVTLHRGLSADPVCAGCSCSVSGLYCHTSIVGHGTFACPSFQTSGNSYNMFSNSCQPINPGTSTHHYDVASFTECAASGTATPSPAKWGETSTFCKADRVGRGCKSGSSCVPKATTVACARKAGDTACTGAYSKSAGAVWSGGVDDTRTCGACQCAGGWGTCNNAGATLYSGVNCTGASQTISGVQGDDCALPFAPASGQVTGAPVANACVPNTYPGGEIKEKDPSTVCCQ